ncbi:hypothetical protein Ait01nite_066060 [Actinoplanes italicus]|uniref:Ankyrin n=1 Tax=Actinoplanes italicus TaxID=113567 RepID=A0A2T0KQG5_9ACTN|nr:hypothetical protein [Actinoplanes italicus]PRX25977.1 hypothetical protein CLV67_101703 [Actinoplanes italicus]GIE33561.1 hypothetical protein Ait01nite_066060 [Actinoplanes italicus]
MSRYEIHLTVSADASDDRLRSWAADRGVKYTRIVLDRGSHASQPMLSWLSDGTPATAEADARRTASELRSSGFPVTRLKVEAAASGREAPTNAAEASDLYFEHHVKLLLSAETDIDLVRTIAARHGAHLSRNARRVRADGVQERFVTQRCYRMGRAEAAGLLAGLLDALASSGVPAPSAFSEASPDVPSSASVDASADVPTSASSEASPGSALAGVSSGGWLVAEVEEEWVLVDDNPGLDAGWFA